MWYTCSLLFWRPPFALSIHVAAEGPGEMFVHHAADVSLVVGEEDTARSQVLSLRGLLLLLGSLLWPQRCVGGRRGRVGRRWWGSWSSGAWAPRHPLGTPGSVHKIPAVRRSSAQTWGSLSGLSRRNGGGRVSHERARTGAPRWYNTFWHNVFLCSRNTGKRPFARASALARVRTCFKIWFLWVQIILCLEKHYSKDIRTKISLNHQVSKYN